MSLIGYSLGKAYLVLESAEKNPNNSYIKYKDRCLARYCPRANQQCYTIQYRKI